MKNMLNPLAGTPYILNTYLNFVKLQMKITGGGHKNYKIEPAFKVS